ncbi:pectinesterase inhibitor 10-like [Alosa sapidissima]|uniref:pectinesterase inhibitor 10-like n=1 Tax=Alosa sapidissima TaxID=34773 RepID=UPI001C090805|nr:pectinesterase inhibitor 10-like [Alosa sapidissima]
MTITELMPGDSGKYWCGTNGTSVSTYEYYTELQVPPRPPAMLASPSSPVPNSSPLPPPTISPQPSPQTTTPSTPSWSQSSSSTFSAVPLGQITAAPSATPELADYENDLNATSHDVVPSNTTASESVYQGLNPNIMVQDLVYQHLNPNTMQDPVYQHLNPNTMVSTPKHIILQIDSITP